jgi:hypothetical protein
VETRFRAVDGAAQLLLKELGVAEVMTVGSRTRWGGSSANAPMPSSGSSASITTREGRTQYELTSLPVLGWVAVQCQMPSRISSMAGSYTRRRKYHPPVRTRET